MSTGISNARKWGITCALRKASRSAWKARLQKVESGAMSTSASSPCMRASMSTGSGTSQVPAHNLSLKPCAEGLWIGYPHMTCAASVCKAFRTSTKQPRPTQ